MPQRLLRMALFQMQLAWIPYRNAIRRQGICVVIIAFVYIHIVLQLVKQKRNVMFFGNFPPLILPKDESLDSFLSRLLTMIADDFQGSWMIRGVKMLCDIIVRFDICPLSVEILFYIDYSNKPLVLQ